MSKIKNLALFSQHQTHMHRMQFVGFKQNTTANFLANTTVVDYSHRNYTSSLGVTPFQPFRIINNIFIVSLVSTWMILDGVLNFIKSFL